MDWSTERIEQLRSLWRDGLSASQIAAALGGITRNAVIGKAHRLGLTGRPSPIKNRPAGPPRPRERRARTEPRPVAPRAAPAPAPRIAEPLPVVPVEEMPGATILTLTDRICKWPIGDPRDPSFHFCGRGAAEGLPYCPEHARRAYQPATKRGGERDESTPNRYAIRR